MLEVLCLVLGLIALIKWIQSVRLPKNFPPGPRFPLPLIGDGYVLMTAPTLTDGFEKLRIQYGDVYGFYMGPKRSVVISDFDLIQVRNFII